MEKNKNTPKDSVKSFEDKVLNTLEDKVVDKVQRKEQEAQEVVSALEEEGKALKEKAQETLETEIEKARHMVDEKGQTFSVREDRVESRAAQDAQDAQDAYVQTSYERSTNPHHRAASPRQESSSSNQHASYTTTPPKARHHGFLGGLCAGALVVGGMMGLQWLHLLPASFQPGVQTEVQGLKTKLQSLSQSLQQTQQTSAQEQQLRNELANLKAQLQALGSQTKALQDQGSQILAHQKDTQEQAVAQQKTVEALKSRLSDTEKNLSNVEEIKQKFQQVVAKNEQTQSALEKQLQDSKALRTQLEEKEKQVALSQEEQNLLLLLHSFQDAVESGHPFSSLLALVKKHFPHFTTEFLSQYSDKGLPRPDALAQEVATVGDKIVQHADEPPLSQHGVLTTLLNEIRRIIAVRPQGPVPGNTIEAIVSRLEDDVKKGHYDLALQEISKLPSEAKDISAEFASKLKAYSEMQQCVNQGMMPAQSKGQSPQ